jgi:hypothetical protein
MAGAGHNFATLVVHPDPVRPVETHKGRLPFRIIVPGDQRKTGAFLPFFTRDAAYCSDIFLLLSSCSGTGSHERDGN